MSKKITKSLEDSVAKIPGVGFSRVQAFKRLGIYFVEDLLHFIPRQVVDFSSPVKIKDLSLGDKRSPILASVAQLSQNRTFRKKMSVTRALLSDNSASIEAVWFNQPYLKRTFKKGYKYLFLGEVRLDKYSNRKIYSNPEFYQSAGVYPVYAQTKGLTSRQISRVIRNALDAGYLFQEYIDSNLLEKIKLLKLQEAVYKLHFPKTINDFINAKRRIIFDRLLEIILANQIVKKRNSALKAKPINLAKYQSRIDKFILELPYKLTKDQFSVITDIMNDFESKKAMNRLLQGDVGSGKTIVGIITSLPIIYSGQKAVWLAPTQVLANQHYKNIIKLVDKKIDVAFLTRSSKLGDLNKADLIVGTHALIQKKVKLDNLGLIIVDEQHRFGVKQREQLKSKSQSYFPHFLSLTATPIPRTLSHIVFGNCDISIISSKPAGRKKIKTYVIPEQKRDDSYKFIKSLIEKKQKVFVICPAIGSEIDPEGDRKAVMHEVERLKTTAIGRCKIEVLHGQMKSKQKQEVFDRFANADTEVLVSTSVVEIGIDVAAATVMVIEDAHNFGLAQLHQFRGRVGRSDWQSYCFCFSQNLDNLKTRARLRAFVQNDDGFKLAELDLKLRGPGALVGLEQSGFSDFNPAWFEDSHLIALAKKTAQVLIINLKNNKCLYNKVKTKLKTTHLE